MIVLDDVVMRRKDSLFSCLHEGEEPMIFKSCKDGEIIGLLCLPCLISIEKDKRYQEH